MKIIRWNPGGEAPFGGRFSLDVRSSLDKNHAEPGGAPRASKQKEARVVFQRRELLGLRAVSVGVALLSSVTCAPSMESVRHEHSQSRSCCASLAELGYQMLGASDDIRFELGKSSRAFDFGTGQSYFAAFEVPEHGSREVRLSSYVVGERPGWYIFHPVVLILDAAHQPVRTVMPEFRWMPLGLAEGFSWFPKLEAMVVIAVPAERYIVVHTTDALLTQATVRETPPMFPTGWRPGLAAFLVPAGSQDDAAVPNAPAGSLRIERADR
jgi:maltose operon protein